MNGLASPPRAGRSFEPVVRQPASTQIRSRRRQEAREEAGYPRKSRSKTTFIIAQGGTGQMLSLADERIPAASLRKSASISTSRWSNSKRFTRTGARASADEMNAGITANNIGLCDLRPALRHRPLLPFGPDRAGGRQLGGYKNPKVDALIDEAKQTFDTQAGRIAGAGACPDRR